MSRYSNHNFPDEVNSYPDLATNLPDGVNQSSDITSQFDTRLSSDLVTFQGTDSLTA